MGVMNFHGLMFFQQHISIHYETAAPQITEPSLELAIQWKSCICFAGGTILGSYCDSLHQGHSIQSLYSPR